MSGGRFGPILTREGTVFRLWAPAAARVEVVVGDRAVPLQRTDGGWFSAMVPGIGAGAHYRFGIDGELEVPDPASAFQPLDVFGPSELIDHRAYRWRASQWRGRPWTETVLVEAHVGTFTAGGSYRAMIDRLDELVATGYTALELMPVADFAGRRGWGYDGVLWYAPDSAYGRPDDLRLLIDEAHLRGLMVFLDVVYNHFGPEGNFLGRYAPNFFSDAQTPWGNAIAYENPEVRAFAIGNALSWLRDYRFDGLRLDAVHAIADHGEPSLLHDLSAAVGGLAKQSGRHIHLVLENDDNRAGLLDPETDPAQGRYRAQWNDDYHHAWHTLLTGERQGYYHDYADAPLRHMTAAMTSGFAYQGEPSAHRGGGARGEPSGHLPPAAFVNFLQNHDQIGNRARGERLESLADPAAIEAALIITLLAPMIPMLFMGEEWGSTRPFPFFCDFQGPLAAAVRHGRRQEFKEIYARYGDEVPDPLDPATFDNAVLEWNEANRGAGRARHQLVRRLLAIRAREIVPRLAGARFAPASTQDDGLVRAAWRLGDGAQLHLTANLSAAGIAGAPADLPGTPIWGDDRGDRFAPWSVFWRVGAG